MDLRELMLVFALSTIACAADEVMVIENFDYPNADAARALWTQREGLPPAGVEAEGKTGAALRIECPFAKVDLDRNYVDRNVKLDLSSESEISVDLFVSNAKAVRSFSLYFRSGAGWYGQSMRLKPGWNSFSMSKGNFNAEDQPTGWHEIDGIRLSPWRGQPVDGFCLVDNLCAQSHDIVVVTGTAAIAKGSAEAKGIKGYAEAMVALLQEGGLSVGSVGDFDVERGALKKAKVALFPYNPVFTDPEVEAMKQFVQAGGKLVVFYTLHGEVAKLLGIRRTDWLKEKQPGEFAEIRFDAADVRGLPPGIQQRSWNITVAEPAGENAQIIGRWFDLEGSDVGRAAVLMSDTGVFMSHILLGGDHARKRQMLLAWLGRYRPEVWSSATSAAIAAAGAPGPMASFQELEQFVQARASRFPKGQAAQDALGQARRLLSRARVLADGDPVKAIETAGQAGQAAGRAYRLCHAPRTCEFRAVWNHSGTGAFDGDWERSMKNLADAGFNAVVPNMWWAGVAHYKSDYLPLSKTYEQYGDQIAACVAAAKKYGIQVHPWKVNWNLSNAPKDFVDKMRSEARTMVDVKGNPTKWLCPSHPKNFDLELKTMVEVAQKYDVDGVHFDYIRYSNGQVCYCDGCRQRFEKKLGRRVENWPDDAYKGELRDAYRDFRCEQITRLVKATAEQVHAIKPYCKISAAVFSSYPGCRDSVGQDWVEWVRQGYLDFVCPMDYIREDHAFAQRVSTQMTQIAGRIPFYPGIGVALRYTKTAEEAIHQLELARDAGADGFIIFNYSLALAQDCVPGLGEGILSEPAIQPHNAPRVVFDLPGKQVEETHLLAVDGPQLRAKATVQSLGQHRKKATGVQARLQLEDTVGRVLKAYGPLAAVGSAVEADVSRRQGKLRLAVAGELVFDDGSKQRFVARSYPFQFVDAE